MGLLTSSIAAVAASVWLYFTQLTLSLFANQLC